MVRWQNLPDKLVSNLSMREMELMEEEMEGMSEREREQWQHLTETGWTVRSAARKIQKENERKNKFVVILRNDDSGRTEREEFLFDKEYERERMADYLASPDSEVWDRYDKDEWYVDDVRMIQ